jgi:site-specific recombinase XerD
MNSIQPYGHNAQSIAEAIEFIPPDASPSVRSRLSQFLQWLDLNERDFLAPDLPSYRKHLLKTMTENSANAHITTIRARYRKHVLKNNSIRADLWQAAAQTEGIITISDTKALVDERLTRLENDLTAVRISRLKNADQRTDEEMGYWLAPHEVERMFELAAERPNRFEQVRDTAILTVMMSTGVRAAELCNLTVEDVFQTVAKKPVVRVRKGKGNKKRLVPLGPNVKEVHDRVRAWLDIARIQKGPLFRGFTSRHMNKVRDTKLTTRQLERIIAQYAPSYRALHPHDLRRTFAATLHDAGIPIVEISAVLGHESIETTMIYLGVKTELVDMPKLF